MAIDDTKYLSDVNAEDRLDLDYRSGGRLRAIAAFEEPEWRLAVHVRGCAPRSMLVLLQDLGDPGKFPRFRRIFGVPSPDGLGDCHEIAFALMLDLITLRRAGRWLWATGECTTARAKGFSHSWLIYDGWVLDASSGKAIIMSLPEFTTMMRAQRVGTRTSRQTLKWMRKVARHG